MSPKQLSHEQQREKLKHQMEQWNKQHQIMYSNSSVAPNPKVKP